MDEKIRVEKIFDHLSENNYLVQLKNDGLFCVGILCTTTEIENGITVQSIDCNASKLETDVDDKKTRQIVVLGCNRYFLILIDKSNNKSPLLKIYYLNKNQNKYVLFESKQVEKWYFDVPKVELINQNAWIVMYDFETKQISVHKYQFNNEDQPEKTAIFTKKALDDFGLKHTAFHEQNVYLFSSDQRFLILYKPELPHIYYIDLTNTSKEPFVVSIEADILDVKIIENSYNLVVNTPIAIKFVSVTIEDGKSNIRDLLEVEDESYISVLRHDILIASFVDHFYICKLNEINTTDQVETHRFQSDNSQIQSNFFVTENRNNLLYSTQKADKKKVLNVINLTSMEKKEIEDDLFDNFYKYDSNYVIMTKNCIPFLFKQ